MHAPYKKHLDATYKILRYLKSSLGRGLLFKKGGQKTIEVYTDADWAGSVTYRNLPLVIARMYGETLSHGGARNKTWWPGAVQKSSIE